MKQNEKRSMIAETFRAAFRGDFVMPKRSEGDYHPADDLEFLERLDNDVLSETERADFFRHVETCPFCRHEIADLIRTGILFGEREPSPNQNHGTVSAVLSAADRSRFLFRNRERIIAAAALVLIMVGAGILFNANRGNFGRLARQQTNPTELISPNTPNRSSVSPNQIPLTESEESPVNPASSSRPEPIRRVRGTLGSETDEALELKMAEQGDPHAQFSVGVRYRNGIGISVSGNPTDTGPDPVRAAEWFRKAADQGYAEAQYELGRCYAEGIGTERIPTEAVEWFRRAADQEYAEAQYELGKCCAEGTGTDQAPVEAALWYSRAADQGHMTAQFYLGLCYAEGFGVERNDDEAVYWLQESIDQCSAKSEAEQMFQKAAEEGHSVDSEIRSRLDMN